MKRIICALIIMNTFLASSQESIKQYENITDLESSILKEISDGRQNIAEKITEANREKFKDYQEYIFIDAVMQRSRFMIGEAVNEFNKVINIFPYNTEGYTSFLIREIDYKRNVEENWNELNKLADKNPDNIWILWLVGIEARYLDKNDEGINAYKKLLGKMNVGSSLMHQTYGNMLEVNGLYEDAIKEREITVKLEPYYWSYDGLANTLSKLKRNEEAETAYKKAIELNANANTYINYTIFLYNLYRYAEAEPIIEKAIEKDNSIFKAWYYYGLVLEGQEKYDEAITALKKAKEINPQWSIKLKRKTGDVQI